jgi:hypothetical protein
MLTCWWLFQNFPKLSRCSTRWRYIKKTRHCCESVNLRQLVSVLLSSKINLMRDESFRALNNANKKLRQKKNKTLAL